MTTTRGSVPRLSRRTVRRATSRRWWPYTELAGNPSNYLVLSLITGEGSGIGTEFYRRAIIEINGNLERDHGPDHYLNVHRYLVDEAIYDAGIQPTQKDLQDIAQDIPPLSIRHGGQSAGHLNAIGYDVRW